MKHYLTKKLLALGVVLLLLMMALSMIQGVVSDRQYHRSQAVASIGSSQHLLGPLIRTSCTETWQEAERKGEEVKMRERSAQIEKTVMPDTLAVTASSDVEPRHRGIHAVNAFYLKSRMAAEWAEPENLRPAPNHKNSTLSCVSRVLLVLADPNGLRSARLRVGDVALKPAAGTTHAEYPRGIHAVLPARTLSPRGPLHVDVELELFGSEELDLVPAAETTTVALSSNWPHPSFGGNFLPAQRHIDERGFQASWRVSAIATDIGNGLAKGRAQCRYSAALGEANSGNCLETLRVSFIDPVNPYTLSDRASKYGLLFIVLTFAAVALFEVMQKLRVHPIQYFLVGSALAIFFLLLLSLSEHLGFDWAYLVAAGACVLLLGYYGTYMLRGLRRGLPFGLGVALLYGVLYLLLQLEQTALVLGSLTLFAALAAIMTLTRRIDWYAATTLPTPPAPEPGPAGDEAEWAVTRSA